MFDFKGQDFFSVKDNFREISHIASKQLYGTRQENCRISIMIPTYLRNTYLKETIDSVLKQTGAVRTEIVVVDNNDDFSDTETLDLLRRYPEDRVCYYKNRKNLGMFGNWNRCLELAGADWVLILHDDDRLRKDYISYMAEIISGEPDLGCIGCFINRIDENGNEIPEEKTGISGKAVSFLKRRKISDVKVRDFYFTHPLNIMGLLVNRKKAVDAGGFDLRWDPVSDYIFIMNLVYRHPAKLIHEKLFDYRIAVNASLKPRHIIGMAEIDGFMREEINRKLNLMKTKTDKLYRSCYAFFCERYCLKKWTVKLSGEQKKHIADDYAEFNQYMGYQRPTKWMMKYFCLFERGYRFYIKYIRK